MPGLLQIDELPDGVRYVLPRRRVWLPLLRQAALAVLLYASAAFLAVGLAVYVGASWIPAAALAAVLVLLLGCIVVSIRSAWTILNDPDVELALRTSRLEVHRHSVVGGADCITVPLPAVRRLVVRSFSEPQPAPPPPPGMASGFRRMLRAWFGPSPEERRAAQRRDAVQRFFGTLVLEGDNDAAVLLAEGRSLVYLRGLAADLAARCAAAGQAVAVVADAAAPPVAVADPRLLRPDGAPHIKVETTAGGVLIEIPRLGSSGAMLAAVLGFGTLAVLAAAMIAFTLTSTWVLAICFGAPLAHGLFAGSDYLLARLRRTVLTISNNMLRVRADYGFWHRESCWATHQAAAFTLAARAANSQKSVDQPRLVHDLMLLDHAMAPTCLIRGRSEAELTWVVALLHKELSLGL